MIEKKTMGYADFGYPRYEAKVVTVMADTETGLVELYRPDDEENYWQQPNDNEHFYPTLDEAQEALQAHRKELRELMPKVREWVRQLDCLREMCDRMPDDADEEEWRENHPDYFDKGDFLPYDIAHNGERNYYQYHSDYLEKENKLLAQAAVLGTLTLKADTFRIDDVKYARWGNERAEVLLKDDRTIETADKWEFNVVARLFGGNIGSYTYTRLNKKEHPDV